MVNLKKGSKKLLNAWAFYDWANSVYSLVITSAVFPIFYQALFRSAEIDTIVEQVESENKAYLDNVEFFNLQQKYASKRLSQDWRTYAERWGLGMWHTTTGGYLGRLYYLFSGRPLHPISDTVSSLDKKPIVQRVFSAVAQDPSTTIIKIFIYIEQFIWIVAVVLALIPVTVGAIRLDTSAWVILAVVSYFIFIPGSMGYSRFRFAVDWLIILQALIGANLLYAWLSAAYQKPKNTK